MRRGGGSGGEKAAALSPSAAGIEYFSQFRGTFGISGRMHVGQNARGLVTL